MSSDGSGTSLPCGLCTFGRRARKSPWAQADTDSWGRAAVSQAHRQLGHRQPASPSASFAVSQALSSGRPRPGPSSRPKPISTVAGITYGCPEFARNGGNLSGRRQPYVTAATSGWGCSQLPVLVHRSEVPSCPAPSPVVPGRLLGALEAPWSPGGRFHPRFRPPFLPAGDQGTCRGPLERAEGRAG